jgi:ankyrin repeat protein
MTILHLFYALIGSLLLLLLLLLRQMLDCLQWIDKEGKTPLMVACMRPDLFDVAKALIELGANVNAYRPGILLIILISTCYFFLVWLYS